MPKHPVILAVLLVILTGCATLAPAPTMCLPPGASLAGATSQTAEVVILEGEVVGGWPAVKIIYAVGRQPVMTLWLGDVLAAIDPDPGNADAPVWIDGGVLTNDGKVRADRGALCQWRQRIDPIQEEKA